MRRFRISSTSSNCLHNLFYLMFIALFSSCLVIAFPTGLEASEIDLFGYFRNEITLSDLSGNSDIILQNKLRMDLEWFIRENILIGGNVNFLNYEGDIGGNYLDNIPTVVSGKIPQEFRDFFDYSFEDELELDNLFARFRFPTFDMTIGKQQISIGSGYAWNPTDLFNVKSLIDPTDEKPGHEALRIDYPLSLSSNLLIILDMEDSFVDPGFMLRYKTTVGHFDYSLSYCVRELPFNDFDSLHRIVQTREMLGFDFAGEAFGVGLWFEGAYNWVDLDHDFAEWVVGMDYTWENGFYLLLEYFHSDLAKGKSEEYDINSWMKYLSGETKALSKDNMYLFSSYPATDLLNIGLTILFSISDGSSALVPTIEYSFAENWYLEIYGGFNLGSAGTVYSDELANGLLVRVTRYF